MIELSQRLQTVARMVRGNRLADIGSDHALLPVYLVSQGKVAFAIAGELNEGPLLAAQKQVDKAGLSDKIDVRQGDGLAVIAPGEVDCVTICGMGGSLIVRILEEGKQRLKGVKQLILQPNVGEMQVRKWLVDYDWYLEEEAIVYEDGQIYEMMHASKVDHAYSLNEALYQPLPIGSAGGDACIVSRQMLLRFGPHLLRQAHETTLLKLTREIAKSRMISQQMAQSNTEQARKKRSQFLQQLSEMEEILKCLQQDDQSLNGLSS